MVISQWNVSFYRLFKKIKFHEAVKNIFHSVKYDFLLFYEFFSPATRVSSFLTSQLKENLTPLTEEYNFWRISIVSGELSEHLYSFIYFFTSYVNHARCTYCNRLMTKHLKSLTKQAQKMYKILKALQFSFSCTTFWDIDLLKSKAVWSL